MRGRLTAILALLCLLGSTPVLAQETIIGSFGSSGNGASGAMRIFGWALADSGVDRVVMQVDGEDVGTALYGRTRPDITALHPDFPDAHEPGFNFIVNTTDYLNGTHQVSLKVTSLDGKTQVVETKEFFFNNAVHNLFPFGAITRPERSADLVGICNLSQPLRRYSVVDGWVLDLGIEIGDSGVGYVELLVDGALALVVVDPDRDGVFDEVDFANTRRSCYFNPDSGGLSNCYGLPSFNIERAYPFAIDAPTAGFRFALDVGLLLNLGWVEGHHTLTIRSGDITGTVANVAEIPVTFTCAENLGNEGSFGRIETPTNGRIFKNTIPIRGWVLDAEGVDTVSVYVDGVLLGNATFPVPGARRIMVEMEYPGFPDTLAPVYELMFDTNLVGDGSRTVEVFATDTLGVQTRIGVNTFFVDNVPD